MKNIYIYIYILVVVFFAKIAQAQNFTVTVPSVSNYQNVIKPIKPENSHQFQVNVKNNTGNDFVVSINESPFNIPSSWVQIDNNPLQINAGATGTFLLTLNIPQSEPDGSRPMDLDFEGIRAGSTIAFDCGAPLTVLIDNLLPAALQWMLKPAKVLPKQCVAMNV